MSDQSVSRILKFASMLVCYNEETPEEEGRIRCEAANKLKKAADEIRAQDKHIAELEAMMSRFIHADPNSDEYNYAVNAIGEYVTEKEGEV